MEDLKILFADDDFQMREMVRDFLGMLDFEVTCVKDGGEALAVFENQGFDVVITDITMPGMSGLELLREIKGMRPETEVIVVTGNGTIESAVEALKLGSYDYLLKPLELQRLKVLMKRLSETRRLEHENRLIRRKLSQADRYQGLVGSSQRMHELYDLIDKVSKSGSPTVLVRGESGTGKELVARIIHKNSDRSDRPYIPVNCGAVAETLLESELFGHAKGAFTGAHKDKIGLFKAADGGTIFLDEIGDLSGALQVKLLRVLQEKTFRPVGDTREVTMDVRVITATNVDLEKAIEEGRFRRDLFYRLNAITIQTPPLREHKEDIAPLVRHFIDRFNRERTRKVSGIDPKAMDVLLTHDWPGNVRELENAIERAHTLGSGERIGADDLPPELVATTRKPVGRPETFNLMENEIRLIRAALEETGGNRAEAARLLGLNTTTVYRKIEKYGIGA
ncbi:MAG: sigma-54-dependent transcriptional regulator [Desulfatibacillaceae bacterium]